MTITGPSRLPQVDAPPRDHIPLPPPRSDERFRRRREQRRLRRQRVFVALLLVAALVGTVAVVQSVRDPNPSGGGGSGRGEGGGSGVAPVPPVLLTEATDTGRAGWITALVPGATGRGGALLLIPAGTMAEVPSLGLDPVGNALAVGGPARLLFTAENVVGASLGHVEQVDAARLAALVGPAGALTVDVPARVEEVLPGGRVQVLYEPGPNRVEPGEVSRFLGAKGRGNDLARLARHQAFWDAWLTKLADDPTLVPEPDSRLGEAIAALAEGRWQARLLPVEAVGSLETGDDIYRVDRDELVELVPKIFPGSPLASTARPRVRILNGTGELELAQRVASLLVPAGVEVTLTGNANPLGQRATQVIYYDPEERPMAEKVRAALGVGILVRNRTATDVVDVTVIVGKDFSPPR